MKTLKGKKCLITGANSGLGLAAAKLFAKSGADVIMLCRNEAKGKAAVAEVKKEIPDSKLDLEICDLASIKSVNGFINRFKQKYPNLDILFNNAAIMKPQLSETDDGFETMFQTNYIAPVLITDSLLNLMKRSKNAKIINIALPSEKLHLDFSDLQSRNNFNSMHAFFKTKLCLLLYSLELSEKLNNSTITVIAADPGPGAFNSNLVKEFSFFRRLLKKMISKNDVTRVAENILFYATDNNPGRAVLYKGRSKVPVISYWGNVSVRNKLMDQTDEMTARLKIHSAIDSQMMPIYADIFDVCFF